MGSTVNIKNNLHTLIDSINNEDLLEIAYQLLNSKKAEKEGELLNKLSVEEKRELYDTYEDSLDDANLIDFDQIKKKHSQWREK